MYFRGVPTCEHQKNIGYDVAVEVIEGSKY